jgi:MFS family permease
MALGASKISISSTSPLRVIAAASIGNALEWFDLLVYGYFALTISRLFFPSSDQTVSLMLGFGTFGASYLVRPLGALVIGAYADKAGRKASLMVSVFLMTIGTLLMAIVPTYAIVGSIAPATILIARLIQGFSVGGEFGGSTSFLVEHGGGRKGFFASFQWAGQGLAAVLASLFGVGLSTLLTPDQVNAWGWRVPYFFGLLIGPVGFYIRRHADETPEFLAAKPTPHPRARVDSGAVGPRPAGDRNSDRLEQLQLFDSLHAHIRRHATEPSSIQRLHCDLGRRRHSHNRIAGYRPLVGFDRPHAHYVGRSGSVSSFGLSGISAGNAPRIPANADWGGVLAQSFKNDLQRSIAGANGGTFSHANSVYRHGAELQPLGANLRRICSAHIHRTDPAHRQ